MSLTDCIPKNKSDLAAVARARQTGFPGLNPVLPDLLEWLQDMNWPVARELRNLIAGAGPEILAHIRRLLVSDDGIWKYGVLTELVPLLDAPVRAALRPDLARLAEHPTDHDRMEQVDLAAKRLLVL